MKWRFINLDCVDNVFAAAVFEAVMKAVGRDLVDDIILFWRLSKPVIYIGYHQLAYEEVHVGLCRERGIPNNSACSWRRNRLLRQKSDDIRL